jgi:thioesterase domain-containing protein
MAVEDNILQELKSTVNLLEKIAESNKHTAHMLEEMCKAYYEQVRAQQERG